MIDGMNFDGVTKCNWRDIKAIEGAPGIYVRNLWTGNNNKRVDIYEFQAGANYGALDAHEVGPEQVYVLSGIFNDGREDHQTGTFLHHPKGSAHVPQSKYGCVLLVIFPEG
jgi:anti-sigma factor ChrR (cupin superfamily)|tara:strand:- start:444 stop:776 length:333 start_codon:yes stop_codon:yes gene_type:complete